MAKYIRALRYFGGKITLLDFLLPLLPYTRGYCEPFGGGASVLINREPSKVEIYNDINSDVVNFFRVLRDNPEELIRKIKYTPYSREEIIIAQQHTEDPVERARRFFVLCEQSVVCCGIRKKKDIQSGIWKRKIGSVDNHPHSFDLAESLEKIAHRLLQVQIENKDALELIKEVNYHDFLIYCDPPYPSCARPKSVGTYFNEVDDEFHVQLAEILRDFKGLCAISSYDNPLYDELYNGWYKTKAPPKIGAYYNNGTIVKKLQQEVLWTNYNPGDFNMGPIFSKNIGGIENE